MKPTVSIIMATYNRAHLILETLESIQKQTYTNWECLIIDDGGSDNTAEVLKPILANDARFQYLQRKTTCKKGLPGSRNYGLDLAKGANIIFFDDDDIVHPQNLELCVKELKNSKYHFCRYVREVFIGDFLYDFDFTNTYTKFEITNNAIEKILKNELPFNSCAVMWKKECFKEHRFEESLLYAEEWELYSRMIIEGLTGISVDKCLFYGRKHPNSNTGEFYNNDPVRLASKKEAVKLVAKNLVLKNKLTDAILKYLVGYSLAFRDFQLLNALLTIAKVSLKKKVYLSLKFRLYPLWKLYKKLTKKIK